MVSLLQEYVKRIVVHNVFFSTDDEQKSSMIGNKRTIYATNGTKTNNRGTACLDRHGRGRRRGSIIHQVSERILIPRATPEQIVLERDTDWVVLPPDVQGLLRAYVTEIARLYRNDNPFHNFEHACHVTLSVCKFLSRMKMEEENDDDRSYGIASDPLTQFACVMAALLHDTDHQGVPSK